MNMFKIRYSHGKVGNDNIGGERFFYESRWGGGGDAKFGINKGGTGNGGGLKEVRNGNPGLTWETAHKFNFGFDSRWFNNRFEWTTDVFYEKRTNILTNIDIVPATYGGPAITANAGKVENKGIELDGTWHERLNKNFDYFVGGMFSFARNKILERPETPRAYPYLQQVGYRVGQARGFIAEGLFQSEEEILRSPAQFGPLYPGNIKYADINGDGVIDDNDQHPIGFTNVPEIMYSVKMGFKYKNFDFSCLFQGAANVNYDFRTGANMPFNNENSTPIVEWLDRWTPENRDASLPRLIPAIGSTGNDGNRSSTFWLKNGNYIRLKNIEIGYTLPDSWMKAIRGTDARLYVNGINLVTWDKVPVYDPENTNASYPLMKVINVGVKVSF